MGFKVVRAGMGLTVGKVYFGNVIWVPAGEEAFGGVEHLKIAVFNDNGRWHSYSPFFFEPAQS